MKKSLSFALAVGSVWVLGCNGHPPSLDRPSPDRATTVGTQSQALSGTFPCGFSLFLAPCTLTATEVDASTTTYAITQPVVNQALTDYRGVVFSPGDRVTISAGGCVQTGGFGATWKRYVDPSGARARPLRSAETVIDLPGSA